MMVAGGWKGGEKGMGGREGSQGMRKGVACCGGLVQTCKAHFGRTCTEVRAAWQ